jgi:hypothetical protein
VPCPAPPSATVLRSRWNYIIKPCGTRKARMCCDGSKRATSGLRFAQTYASCIDKSCIRLFFALSAAMGFVVVGADCLTPMPTSRRLPKRHTSGLTTPIPSGIALAMERKSTARWYYQCLKPCRDTPSTSTRLSTIPIPRCRLFPRGHYRHPPLHHHQIQLKKLGESQRIVPEQYFEYL